MIVSAYIHEISEFPCINGCIGKYVMDLGLGGWQKIGLGFAGRKQVWDYNGQMMHFVINIDIQMCVIANVYWGYNCHILTD